MIAVYIFTFCMGAILGSFLNVVGLRLLRDESIVLPASRCYNCNEKIKPYDNIPIVSWLLLKGKCRNCQVHISKQYPAIELATALLAVATVYQFGITFQAAFLLFLIANLMIILITDFKEQYIYDYNSIGLIPFGLAYTYLNLGDVPGIREFSLGYMTLTLPHIFVSALVAVGGSFVIFGALNLLSVLMLGKPGFGEGDTRLLMGVGSFFGLKLMVMIFITSFVLQAAIGIPMLVFQWYKQKAYKLIALLVVGFVFALLPYVLKPVVSNDLVLLGLALGFGIIAMTATLKALRKAKELPTGLTYLPFGPALVFATLLAMFFQGQMFSVFRLFLPV